MKIDIPILGFGRSGGYRVLSRLATEWKHRGHTVRILCAHASESPYFPTEAEIIWLGHYGNRVAENAPHLLGERNGFSHVASGLISLLLGLCRFSRSSDVIVANHSLTAWPVFLSVSRAYKVYYIQAYEAEYYESSKGFRRILLWTQAWLSYCLPMVRVVNAPVYLRYRNLRSSCWIPPGVDFSIFNPERSRLPCSSATVTLACIGRKEPEKGIRYVIEAFSILKKRDRNVRLLVAYGNLPEKATSIPGIEIRVPTNDSELAQFYRSADVFVAPALGQRGAPHYPVMEAMACGVPVVTTGYLPANSLNCWLVPEKDPIAIANAVDEIMANPAVRQQRTRLALSDIGPFSWSTVAGKMLAVWPHSQQTL